MMTWVQDQIKAWDDDKIVDDDPRTVAWLLARLVEYDRVLVAHGQARRPMHGAELDALKAKLDFGPLHDRDAFSVNDEEFACAPFSRWARNVKPV